MGEWNLSFKNLVVPAIIFSVFFTYGFWIYLKSGNIFYILNFSYIGGSIALGSFFMSSAPKKLRPLFRRIVLFLIGIYLVVFVGLYLGENMQIEGFFFYLLGGIFSGVMIHYLIAKVFGPLIFGRGFCGWGCWIAMILELLPYKKPSGRIKNLGIIRYIVLLLSFGIVFYFWNSGYTIYGFKSRELLWFIVGLVIYYLFGITMAFIFKDNRAFCKYLCPIPPIQKILGRFALLKVSIDKDKCIGCGLCEKNCPMDIKLLDYKNKGKRVLSTECILCTTCLNICPKDAININPKFDFGEDILKYK